MEKGNLKMGVNPVPESSVLIFNTYNGNVYKIEELQRHIPSSSPCRTVLFVLFETCRISHCFLS